MNKILIVRNELKWNTTAEIIILSASWIFNDKYARVKRSGCFDDSIILQRNFPIIYDYRKIIFSVSKNDDATTKPRNSICIRVFPILFIGIFFRDAYLRRNVSSELELICGNPWQFWIVPDNDNPSGRKDSSTVYSRKKM